MEDHVAAQGVDQVNQVENGSTPTAQAGWQAARRYGWRVFWISFLLGLPTLVLTMIGLLPLIVPLVLLVLGLTGAGPGGLSVFEPLSRFLICFIPACCLGVLLGEFFGVIGALAERVCIFCHPLGERTFEVRHHKPPPLAVVVDSMLF